MAKLIERIGRTFGIKNQLKASVYDMLERGDLTGLLNLADSPFIDSPSTRNVVRLMKEYDPDQHEVHNRTRKPRHPSDTHIPNVIALPNQVQANDIETSFLYGQEVGAGLNLSQDYTPAEGKEAEGVSETWNAVQDLLKDIKHDSLIREAKGLAGSEGRSATLFTITKNEQGEPKIRCRVLAYSKGDTLREFKDHLGETIFASHEYIIKGKANIRCCDIHTPNYIYHFRNNKPYENAELRIPFKEVNELGIMMLVIRNQKEAWWGAQPLYDRNEELSSQIADVTDKNSDPDKIYYSNDLESLKKQMAENANFQAFGGKVLGLTDINNTPRYVTFSEATDLKKMEAERLEDAARNATYTPDLSMKSLLGAGQLSGKALRRVMYLGYIKRAKNVMIYGKVHEQEFEIVKAILRTFTHAHLTEYIDLLNISFSFAEPFEMDNMEGARYYAELYRDGVMSLETTVKKIDEVSDPKEEVDRILAEKGMDANFENQSMNLGEL